MPNFITMAAMAFLFINLNGCATAPLVRYDATGTTVNANTPRQVAAAANFVATANGASTASYTDPDQIKTISGGMYAGAATSGGYGPIVDPRAVSEWQRSVMATDRAEAYATERARLEREAVVDARGDMTLSAIRDVGRSVAELRKEIGDLESNLVKTEAALKRAISAGDEAIRASLEETKKLLEGKIAKLSAEAKKADAESEKKPDPDEKQEELRGVGFGRVP